MPISWSTSRLKNWMTVTKMITDNIAVSNTKIALPIYGYSWNVTSSGRVYSWNFTSFGRVSSWRIISLGIVFSIQTERVSRRDLTLHNLLFLTVYIPPKTDNNKALKILSSIFVHQQSPVKKVRCHHYIPVPYRPHLL